MISRTPAKITHHPFANLLLAGIRRFTEQRGAGDDLTRRTDAALKTALCHKRFPQRVGDVAVQSLDRFNAAAVDRRGQNQTRRHQPSVDQHAAAAAHADAAAFFGSRQAKVVTQEIDEQPVRANGERFFYAVQPEADRSATADLPSRSFRSTAPSRFAGSVRSAPFRGRHTCSQRAFCGVR